MAKPQREKGLRRERQITTRLNDLGLSAARISRPYKSGPDLEIAMPSGKKLTGEVKGRKPGATPFPTLHKMFGTPPADTLFLIEDQNDPLVVLRWSAFRTLIEEVTQDERRQLEAILQKQSEDGA